MKQTVKLAASRLGLNARVTGEFIRFGIVGVGGLLVDMAALWVALNLLHANIYWGRFFSYLVAATFTWACNRRLTFRGAHLVGGPLMQWIRYLVVSAAGGMANFAVYTVIVTAGPRIAVAHPFLPWLPYFGVACGSITGLLLNFASAKKLVFKLS